MLAKNSGTRLSKEEFLERAQNLTLSKDKAIMKLTQKLYQYKEKYKMRSELFYRLIVRTPLEDQPDFIDWAMCYRAYFKRIQSKFSLKEAMADVL